jgi:hypothetical protein
MAIPDLKYLMCNLTHQCTAEYISGHSESQVVAALDPAAVALYRP